MCMFCKCDSVKSSLTTHVVNYNGAIIVKVVISDIPYGPFYGKVISKDTIRIKLDGGEKLKLKWKDKIISHLRDHLVDLLMKAFNMFMLFAVL